MFQYVSLSSNGLFAWFWSQIRWKNSNLLFCDITGNRRIQKVFCDWVSSKGKNTTFSIFTDTIVLRSQVILRMQISDDKFSVPEIRIT